MRDEVKLKQIIEGLLLAAGKPLSLEQIASLFEEGERPDNTLIREALERIAADCAGRGFELVKVASGWRFQVRAELSTWIGRLWEEKPQKYSRALLETLAIIAYRQPITRGDIEKIRGVAVSTNITRTLLDREWVRVVGHRDVPGRPAMYATTRQFLDYFNLDSLEQLPALAEIRELEDPNQRLRLEDEEPQSRVLDLPGEEEAAEDSDADELLDVEEAAALASRPLDEILAYGQDEDPEEDEDSDDAEARSGSQIDGEGEGGENGAGDDQPANEPEALAELESGAFDESDRK